jgi:hypothetical protein
MDTLQEFLEVGRLGPLVPGLSVAQAERALGVPDDVGVNLPIWKFGALQIAFDSANPNAVLVFIGVYFRDANSVLPKSITVQGWFPNPGATKEQVLGYLTSHAIEYRADPQLSFDTQSAFRSKSGAHIVFDMRNGSAFLDSIQLLDERHTRE